MERTITILQDDMRKMKEQAIRKYGETLFAEETPTTHRPTKDPIDRMLEQMRVTLNEAGEVEADSEVEGEIMQPVMQESRVTAHQCHGGVGPSAPGEA